VAANELVAPTASDEVAGETVMLTGSNGTIVTVASADKPPALALTVTTCVEGPVPAVAVSTPLLLIVANLG
jgi:hypothetical protein